MLQKWSKLILLLIVAVAISANGYAQNGTIFLFNSSFEDLPRHSHTPSSWTNCGFVTESAPDIHPDYGINEFKVSKAPLDGQTYLGMVVRANDTWESVGQAFSKPMEKGTCYEFSISLARSLSYISGVSSNSADPSEKVNFVTPIKLRIWAGFGDCDKRVKLDESPLVENTHWKEFRFKFEPEENYTHIILEAFYKTPTLILYNGNVLLDRASAITVIPCDEDVPDEPQDVQPLAVATPKAPSPVPIAPVVQRPQPTPPATNNTTTDSEPTIAGVKRSDLSTGQVIRLENLQFEADSSRIIDASKPALNELYHFLSTNKDVAVEIGGHTNGWADQEYAVLLSTNRAKSVARYLIRRGIAPNRVTYRGYGKEVEIASNATAEGRRKNQRVEIKILTINNN